MSQFLNIFAPPRDLILVVAAIWVGLYFAEKWAPKHGVKLNDLNNIIFLPMIGYIIGGRLLFAIENFSAFAKNPQSLVSLNLDLFDPSGGLLIAGIVALIYGQRKKLSLWPTLDALTPVLAIFAVGIALSHLASGSAFGKETSLPWGVELWGVLRHPSQIYEIIAALLILSLLWFQKPGQHPGVYFLNYIGLTIGARLFLEAFRGDSVIILGGLRLAQVVAWIFLAMSLFLLGGGINNISKVSIAQRKRSRK
ncbi:MAG: prolipoprotein diacylglyceryl transferase [Anaerolineae bacterium]|nr:prolipoprotein diacylglyceryl transferase [Anaerolineae bacterium]